MNLTTDPWIPAVEFDGKAATISLRGAFERGDQIQDLAVRPHERVALYRLLICVAQAALSGPADSDEWETCQPRIAPLVIDYLARWNAAFELFGDGPRFLQVTCLEKAARAGRRNDEPTDRNGTPASKLDLALATGNNPTLFDNAGGSRREFKPCDLALMLLTFQCFSPCGRIGIAAWNGVPTTGNGSSAHAPCLAGNMVHAMVRADSLLESLRQNLITHEHADLIYGSGRWGVPVWERMPNSPNDRAATFNATQTYLGRLVPLTRAISIGSDRQSLLLANGIEYSPFPAWREPSATIVTATVRGRPNRAVLGASIGKAVWRELHALTVKAIGDNTNGGAVALQNASGEDTFDLWVGGLVAKGNGKLLDTIESVFRVPPAMLGDPGQRIYAAGVETADAVSRQLRVAVSVYHRELGDRLDRPEMRGRRNQIQSSACAQFWTDTEGAVRHLLAVAANPACLGLNAEWRDTPWGSAVWRAARDAYDRACPHSTPRQIRAYALGREVLLTSPKGKKRRETEKDT
jgi:CRISPR system Cascade subunit CasA